MSEPVLQLFSQCHFLGDGSTTVWNFTFEDGYISQSYVKAYQQDLDELRTEIVLAPEDFTGEFQLTITPPIADGYRLVIYRDTPKSAPIVNYEDGARVSEPNLDRQAKQCIHAIAEVLDGSGVDFVTSDLGFKRLKRNAYTGASTIDEEDDGKSHYKTDGTGVTVPAGLDVEFLCSITNNSDSTMNIAIDGTGYLSGGEVSGASWVLAPRSILTLSQVAADVWFLSGPIVLDA